jgi:hypothetical protein
MKRIAAAALAAGLSLAGATLPTSLAAQQEEEVDWFSEPGENTRGIMVALYLGMVPGIEVTGRGHDFGTNVETVWGTSYGATIGYGMSSSWMLYLNIDRSDHETNGDFVQSDVTTLHHVEGGVRYNRHYYRDRLVGYASLGVGMRQLYAKEVEDPAATDGTSRLVLTARELAPGVGAQYFFSRKFAVDGNVQLGLGDFHRLSGDYDLQTGQKRRRKFNSDASTSLRVRVGVAWYPSAP